MKAIRYYHDTRIKYLKEQISQKNGQLFQMWECTWDKMKKNNEFIKIIELIKYNFKYFGLIFCKVLVKF